MLPNKNKINLDIFNYISKDLSEEYKLALEKNFFVDFEDRNKDLYEDIINKVNKGKCITKGTREFITKIYLAMIIFSLFTKNKNNAIINFNLIVDKKKGEDKFFFSIIGIDNILSWGVNEEKKKLFNFHVVFDIKKQNSYYILDLKINNKPTKKMLELSKNALYEFKKRDIEWKLVLNTMNMYLNKSKNHQAENMIRILSDTNLLFKTDKENPFEVFIVAIIFKNFFTHPNKIINDEKILKQLYNSLKFSIMKSAGKDFNACDTIFFEDELYFLFDNLFCNKKAPLFSLTYLGKIISFFKEKLNEE